MHYVVVNMSVQIKCHVIADFDLFVLWTFFHCAIIMIVILFAIGRGEVADGGAEEKNGRGKTCSGESTEKGHQGTTRCSVEQERGE